MLYLRKIFLIILFLTLGFQTSITLANEFLIGNFKGKSFKVEKGNRVMTDKNLYSFKSDLLVKEISKNRIEMIINSALQMKKGSPIRKDRRRDKFKIKWDDKTSGSLINESSKYKNDKSKFKISGNILSIRSWIDRNKMYETQVYELTKP